MRKLTLNEILDRIMVEHNLPSRHAARRWIIEAQDAKTRAEMTGGHKQGVVIDMESGELGIPRATKKTMRRENPYRKIVDSDLSLLPPSDDEEEREVETLISPNLSDIPLGPLFPRVLHEIQNNKKPHRKQRAKSVRSTPKPRPKKRKTDFSVKKRPTQTKPREGTKSREIYELLRTLDWDCSRARDHLIEIDSPVISGLRRDHKFKGQVFSSILMVKKRYGPDADATKHVAERGLTNRPKLDSLPDGA